ncbi:putative molecular chaperone [Peziza echinospora]|nr:putative molecular chaperone [Peziza echinospora]
MSGKRILDLISLSSAARSVLSQHLRIRSHQWDVYVKTSSVLRPLLSKEGREQVYTGKDDVSRKREAEGGMNAIVNVQESTAEVAKTGDGATTHVPAAVETTKKSTKDSGPVVDPEVYMLRSARGSTSSAVLGGIPQLKKRVVVEELVKHPAVQWREDRAASLAGKKPELKEKTEKIPKEMEQTVDTDKKGSVLELRDTTLEAPSGATIKSDTTAQKQKVEDEAIAATVISTPIEEPTYTSAQPTPSIPSENAKPAFEMSASKVPSSQISRLWHYGSLAAGMSFGALSEGIKRATVGSTNDNSIMFSEANVERMVKKLSRMRGAALKLGQMLSFQDVKMLPPAIHTILTRVQDSADYMPIWQRDQTLSRTLGPDWRSHFSSFTDVPIAAASIGQVHSAILAETGLPVAVKIQYPGVKNSIDSDLNNLSLLLTASKILPKGMYLDKTIANARTELAWECDYLREAEAIETFRGLLTKTQEDRDTFTVPRVIQAASGEDVLTMEFMHGMGVTSRKLAVPLTQKEKDYIGTTIMKLSLREIAEFAYMQTDPNWSNFLWNPATQKVELLDFGASRAYPREFIALYLTLLRAAARRDRDACIHTSIELGYLTGVESQTMLNAHVESLFILAEPFVETNTSEGLYDFASQTVTDRVRALIPVMMRERLSPPPEETYSLHRKLSGAFLLCARLGSKVKCSRIFEEVVGR